MTLDKLDKNSKYGYQRKTWSGSYYAAFNGTTWVFVGTGVTAEPLRKGNAKADDWALTNIPNKFYKRVAIVTDWDDKNFDNGDRIIQCNDWSPTLNKWMHADYRNKSITYRTIGADCEWEDEMESKFPCFRKWRTDKLVVEFTAPHTGTVVVADDDWNLGDYYSEWVHHNDHQWEPCEDPSKRKFKVGDVIINNSIGNQTRDFLDDYKYTILVMYIKRRIVKGEK